MATALGVMTVQIVGEIGGLVSALNQGEKKVENFSKKTIEKAKMLEESGKKAAIAGAAIVTSLIGIAQQSAVAANEIDFMSKRTGMSAEAFQELTYAAEQSNVDVNLMADTFSKLARKMSEAEAGSGAASETFNRLGISVTDGTGNLRAADQVFIELADRLNELGNHSERTAVAMQLFEDTGVNLLPFLSKGSAGIKELCSEARSLGLVISNEGVANLDRYNDTLQSSRAALSAVGRQIAADLAPTFLSAAQAVLFCQKTLAGINPTIRQFGSTFVASSGLILAAGGTIIKTLSSVRLAAAAVGMSLGGLLATVSLVAGAITLLMVKWRNVSEEIAINQRLEKGTATREEKEKRLQQIDKEIAKNKKTIEEHKEDFPVPTAETFKYRDQNRRLPDEFYQKSHNQEAAERFVTAHRNLKELQADKNRLESELKAAKGRETVPPEDKAIKELLRRIESESTKATKVAKGEPSPVKSEAFIDESGDKAAAAIESAITQVARDVSGEILSKFDVIRDTISTALRDSRITAEQADVFTAELGRIEELSRQKDEFAERQRIENENRDALSMATADAARTIADLEGRTVNQIDELIGRLEKLSLADGINAADRQATLNIIGELQSADAARKAAEDQAAAAQVAQGIHDNVSSVMSDAIVTGFEDGSVKAAVDSFGNYLKSAIRRQLAESLAASIMNGTVGNAITSLFSGRSGQSNAATATAEQSSGSGVKAAAAGVLSALGPWGMAAAAVVSLFSNRNRKITVQANGAELLADYVNANCKNIDIPNYYRDRGYAGAIAPIYNISVSAAVRGAVISQYDLDSTIRKSVKTGIDEAKAQDAAWQPYTID